MISSGPSGFYQAPVTMIFQCIVGLFFFINADEASHPPKSMLMSLHRLFGFDHGLHAIYAFLLIYSFRQFERRMSSRKFSFYFLFISGLSLLMYLIRSRVLTSTHTLHVPTVFIFATFILFFIDIPSVRRGSFMGIPISEKTSTYIIGGLYLLTSRQNVVWSAIVGTICGAAYRTRFFPFRNMEIMKALSSFGSQYLSSWVQPTNPRRPIVSIAAGQQFINVHEMEISEPRIRHASGTPIRRANTNPDIPIDEDHLHQLVGMGFSIEQATQALRATNNNIELAAALLLG